MNSKAHHHSVQQLQWFLVSNCGFSLPLHHTMISLGRENCDVILESSSADGKHAIISYDHYEKRFKVKDLNTINGTYVNENRIPVHTFVLLQHLDCLRFGFVIYQVQGISRVYSGPSYQQQHHHHYTTAYPSAQQHNYTSYISSPSNFIYNKMTDCRSCDCKAEVEHLGGKYSAADAGLRQDYCGNNIIERKSEPNGYRNGHVVESSSSPAQQHQQQQRCYPMTCLSADSDGQFASPGTTTTAAAADNNTASPQTPLAAKNDFTTQGCSTSLPSSLSGEPSSKCGAMVVMEAEKPYSLSENDGIELTSPRPLSTAFTVDFEDNRLTSISAKKLDIKDSISKFAPPKPENEMKSGHRRNLSLPKIGADSDENGNEEKGNSPLQRENSKDAVWDVVGRTHGLGPSKTQLKECLGPVRGGYLSEGHMSSDQDEELSAKSDPTRNPTSEKEMVKATASPLAVNRNTVKSLKSGARRSLPVAGLRDSAKYLISRMFGEVTAPPSSPSDPPAISPVGPVSKLALVNATISNTNNNTSSNGCLKKADGKSGSRSSLTSNTTYTVDARETAKAAANKVAPKQRLKEVQVEELDVPPSDGEQLDDEEKDEDVEEEQQVDEGSETGTYTIEKEGDNSDEVKEARKNIDIVFGVKNSEEEIEMESPDVTEDKKSKMSTPSKPNASWLKDWAAASLEAKFNQEDISSPATTTTTIPQQWPATPSPTSVTQFSSFSTSSAPEVPQRPRRRLPVIPTDKLKTFPPSVHLNGMNNSAKTGGSSNSNRSSPEGNRSDSTGMDTETILKETETVVTAMEARMDHQRLNQKEKPGGGGRGRDSGGESDVDTSTASASNEVELRPKKLMLHKKVAAQLKSQLKSLEDDPCFEARSLSPRTLRRSLMGSVSSHGRTTPTDSVSEVETASIQSDISSSSELSGSSPVSKRKHRESAPLMRFNRAFSLRRARLGCESDSSSPQTTPSTNITSGSTSTNSTPAVPIQISRPNSASSAASSKGKHFNSNYSNSKSDSGGSNSSAAVKKSTRPPPVAANSSFSRSDGGRFSLRLPRNAVPPARPSSAKTVSSTPAPPVAPVRVKSAGSGGRSNNNGSHNTPRSNSTLSAKELELKNWKRRKEYDPLKAAAEGRKKESVRKNSSCMLTSKSESPSPTSNSFHRSASFHGTDNLNGAVSAKSGAHLRRNTFSLEDADTELSSLSTRHSDLESETASVSTTTPIAHRFLASRKSSEDELEATRALSHTELDADNSLLSPRDSPVQHVHPSLRHKNKVDALDNLVISTIYQLSCHLRGNVEHVLTKIRETHGASSEEALGNNGLNELLERLALDESPISSPQARSVSKQLSGILKNLKRLEESLHVVDRIFDSIPPVQPQKDSHKKWNGFKDQEYY